jgi:hypothetical protein
MFYYTETTAIVALDDDEDAVDEATKLNVKNLGIKN